MTMSLADKSNKSQKVKVLPITGTDPEAHRHEMIKVSTGAMQVLCCVLSDVNHLYVLLVSVHIDSLSTGLLGTVGKFL